MFDIIKFFNNFLHYNRNIDADQEEIWDIMICGKAAGAKKYVAKHLALRYIINLLVSLVLFYFISNAIVAGVEQTNSHAVLAIVSLVLLFILDTVEFIVTQCMGKFSNKVKFLISLVIAALVGILISVIAGVIIIINP